MYVLGLPSTQYAAGPKERRCLSLNHRAAYLITHERLATHLHAPFPCRPLIPGHTLTSQLNIHTFSIHLHLLSPVVSPPPAASSSSPHSPFISRSSLSPPHHPPPSHPLSPPNNHVHDMFHRYYKIMRRK